MKKITIDPNDMRVALDLILYMRLALHVSQAMGV